MKINHIAANIRFLRASLKLSQSAFADLFEVSRDNIASYERGSEPRISFLSLIVDYFHISYEDFIHREIDQSFFETKCAQNNINQNDIKIDMENDIFPNVHNTISSDQSFSETRCAQNVTELNSNKKSNIIGNIPNMHNSLPISDSDIDKCRSPEIVYKEDPAKDEIIRLQQKNIALLEDKVYQLKNQLRIASFGDTRSIQTTSADVAAESQKQLNVERGPHPNQAKSHQ